MAGTVGFEPTLSESKSDVFTTSLCANVDAHDVHLMVILTSSRCTSVSNVKTRLCRIC